jgi:hypothetical protein
LWRFGQFRRVGLFAVCRRRSGVWVRFVFRVLCRRSRPGQRLGWLRRGRKKLAGQQKHGQRDQHETYKSSLIQSGNLFWREFGQFGQFVIR